MIAALQRVLLSLWLASISVSLGAWHVGQLSTRAGLLIVAALLTGHALVLAGEFLAMHGSNRDDPAPRAGWQQVLAAWWQESLHAPRVFFWRQPLQHRRWPDNIADAEAGTRGVVLVHGYFCNRGLWNAWMARLTRNRTPFIAVDLNPAFGSIDAYAAVVDDAVRRMTQVTRCAPVVVAHSMGGLAVRRWWADKPADALHHLITLGSPHHGTRLARLGTTANARQMRESSLWLQTLHAREQAAARRRITCVYSHCDNIVFPASRAVLAEARPMHLPGTPHVAMVDHPSAWALLQEQLRTAPARPAASGRAPCSRTAP